jgi:hypothetical protein
VFIISPTSKGGLLDRPPPKLQKLTAPLSPIAFNDLFCLTRPEIHTISIGAVRPSDFDAHVAAVKRIERGVVQAARTVASIARRLDQEQVRVLGRPWAHGWRVGLPAWSDAPGQVNVREILRLHNLAKAFDLVEHGRRRYNLLGQGGHWFPGQTAASIDRRAMLKALSGSPFPERVVEALAEAHRIFGGEAIGRLQQP